MVQIHIYLSNVSSTVILDSKFSSELTFEGNTATSWFMVLLRVIIFIGTQVLKFSKISLLLNYIYIYIYIYIYMYIYICIYMHIYIL